MNLRFFVTTAKRRKEIVLIAAIVLYAICYFALSETQLFAQYPMAPLFPAAIAAGALYLAMKRYTDAKYKEFGAVLTERCEPDAFTGIYRELIRLMPRSDNNITYELNICIGLTAAGEYEEARKALEKLNSIGVLAGFYYLFMLSRILIGLGETDKAKEAIDACEKSLAESGSGKVPAEELKKRLAYYRHILELAEGNAGSGAGFFEEYFASAVDENSRVGAKYYSGLAYELVGEKAKAKEAFEYAAQHGGTLHIAKLARERLNGNE